MIPSFAQPSSIGQRYTVIQRLGGGAMGAVFLAMDEVRHERVAIKVPAASRHWRAEYERRVVKEIGILSALQHPNIIEIHDWGQDPQLGPYIVMEYIEGGSVRQMMARYPGERLPPLEAMRIVAIVADALAYAHARPQPIIHRDIKPDNILVRQTDGWVKVSDFGLAAVLTGKRAQTQWGTPDYIAPEQALGKGADARSDMYALAGTLFHMLTGLRPPSLGQQLPGRPSALMTQGVLHSDQARRIDLLIITMLAYDPDQRRPAPDRKPWRASDVAEELRAIIERRPANVYASPEDSAIFPALLTGMIPPPGAPMPPQARRPGPVPQGPPIPQGQPLPPTQRVGPPVPPGQPMPMQQPRQPLPGQQPLPAPPPGQQVPVQQMPPPPPPVQAPPAPFIQQARGPSGVLPQPPQGMQPSGGVPVPPQMVQPMPAQPAPAMRQQAPFPSGALPGPQMPAQPPARPSAFPPQAIQMQPGAAGAPPVQPRPSFVQPPFQVSGALPAPQASARASNFSSAEQEGIVGVLVGAAGVVLLALVVPQLPAPEGLDLAAVFLLRGLIAWGIGLALGIASPRGRRGLFPILAVLITLVTLVIGFPLVQVITEVIAHLSHDPLQALGEALWILVTAPLLLLGTVAAWLATRILGRNGR